MTGDEYKVERWQIARVKEKLAKVGVEIVYFGYYLPIRGGIKEADFVPANVQVGLSKDKFLYDFEMMLVKDYPIILKADATHGEFVFYMRPQKPQINLKELVKEILESNG